MTAPAKKPGWDCHGCTRTVQDGPLWRMNEKGQPGIFMCSECRDRTENEDLEEARRG